MPSINTISLLVHDYDEAIAFYTQKLGFHVVEDIPLPDENKRWVLIAPSTDDGSHHVATQLLLARASNETQSAAVGNQSGGRVFLFLNTEDFWRDHTAMTNAGVLFHEAPREESYGIVAVFQDLYGNLWDLIQPH